MSRATFADYDARDVVSRKEAAALLGVSSRTLESWAQTGLGPKYARLGEGPAARVRYRIAALTEWLAERERQSTTEDAR
jgi:phage terminase Nu1 subunit (DNA packaging protein)